MSENELLQTILNKLESLEKGQDALQQGQTALQQGQTALQQGQAALQQDVTKIKITLENEIDRKLSVLFEGHQLESEKAGTVEEKVDDIESSLWALEVVTRNNIKEINKLKAKIG